MVLSKLCPKIYASLLCSAITALVLSCSAQKLSTRVDLEAEPSSEKNEFQEAAKHFDAYLTKGLSSSEAAEYKAKCEAEPSKSPFCFSVLERHRFEKAMRQFSPKRPAKESKSITKVKFSKKKISNWPDLRFSSVSSIIKGLKFLTPNNLEAVRTYAMKEKRCPNNAALAVASQLEDLLPDKYRYSELAKVYEKAALCPMDGPETLEVLWTRAGLLHLAAKHPKPALKAFKKATQTEASFKARSLYWLYKTQLELSEFKNAKATFENLRENYPFSFHTLIAVTNRNEDPGKILDHTHFAEKKRSSSNSDINRLLEQIEVLHTYGFHASASRLLDWAMTLAQQESEPELLVYIADLKEEQGDHVSRISLLSEVLYENPRLISRATMERYFPKPYFPIFEGNSEGIDPYLLLAIARRESAFNPKARSSANARGLLQVTPRTARKLSSASDLFEPTSNVNTGAKLFGDLLKRLGGQIHFALAAYNAGPSRIATWTNRYPLEDPILFIDLIPYRETREYVAAVLRNYYWYQKLNRSNSPVSPSGMLNYQVTEAPSSSRAQPISPIRSVPE